MKRIGWLILIMVMVAGGCVTVDNATVIDADQQGFANGQFRDVRSGKISDIRIWGGGAGAGAASSGASLLGLGLNAITAGASDSSSSGGGGGFFGIRILPAPAQGDPVPFARSVAMINYSKKLKSIKYDEAGGIVEYSFDQQPLTQRSSTVPSAGQRNPSPSSFGYQPIE